MVIYDKKTIVALTLLISVSIIYITAPYFGVRVRIDNDKSSFYVKNNNNRWVISGREYVSIFDGTSKMNRKLDSIKTITYTPMSEDDMSVRVVRETHYIRGPVIIDTWEFDAGMEDVKNFPVSHQVEVINGTGFFLRYEVRDLVYDGETYKTEEKTLDFGRNMTVDLEYNSRWTWIYKSGIVKAQYDIDSDYEVFNFRLYDPLVLSNLFRYVVRNIESEEPFFLTANTNSIIIDKQTKILQIDGTLLVNTTNISQPVGTKYFGFSFNASLNDGEMWIEKPNGGYLHLTKADFKHLSDKCIGDKCYEDIYYTTFASAPENKVLNYRIKFIFNERPKTFMMYFGTGSTGIEVTDGNQEVLENQYIHLSIGDATHGGSGYIGSIYFRDNSSSEYYGEVIYKQVDSIQQSFNKAGAAACEWRSKGGTLDYIVCYENDDVQSFYVPRDAKWVLIEGFHATGGWNWAIPKMKIAGSLDSENVQIWWGAGNQSGANYLLSSGVNNLYTVEPWKAYNVTSEDWLCELWNYNDTSNVNYVAPDNPYFQSYIGLESGVDNYRISPGAAFTIYDRFHIANSTDNFEAEDCRQMGNRSYWSDNITYVFNTGSLQETHINALIPSFNGSHTVTSVDMTITAYDPLYPGHDNKMYIKSHNMSLGTVNDIYIYNHTGSAGFTVDEIWAHYTKSSTSGGEGTPWVYGSSDPTHAAGLNVTRGNNVTMFCNATNQCNNIMSNTWTEEFFLWTEQEISATFRVRYGVYNVTSPNILVNGTNRTEYYVETGHPINITCKYTDICTMTINNSVLGLDFGTDEFIWNFAMNGLSQLNTTNSSQNISFASAGNISIGFWMNENDTIANLTFNVSAFEYSGTYPTEVKIFINGSLSNILGNINTSQTIITFNDSQTQPNITWNKTETKRYWVTIPKNARINSAVINISGLNSTFYILNTDNFVDSPKAGYGSIFRGSNLAAMKFNAGAGNITNKTWGLRLYRIATSDTTFTISLYNNIGGKPGTGLASVSPNILELSLDPTGIWFNYTFTTALTPDLDYWIVASAPDANDDLMWNGSIYTTDKGAYSGQSGSQWSINNYMYNMRIQTGHPPHSPHIDVGGEGVWDWFWNGSFNQFGNVTADFSANVSAYLTNCTADANGFCNVPIDVYNQYGGLLYFDVAIAYTIDPNIVEINKEMLNSYLDNSTGWINLPIEISSESAGRIKVDAINNTYYGANVYNLTVYNDANDVSDTANLYVRYSNRSKGMPYTWTDKILWYAEDNNDTYVNPYMQTNSTPIYNITLLNYVGNVDFYVKINNTVDCANHTVALNNSYADAVNLTTSWQRIKINATTSTTNNTLWMWNDLYNCPVTAARFFARDIELKTCCGECLC